MAYNDDSSVSGHDEPWIQWFCGLKGHEMFCEVERAYIEDGFNLYGLRACVPNFSECLDLMLDRIGLDDSDDSHLTQSACTLYGLIHARYIITAHGLDAMYNKYAQKEFGTCPLVQCRGQPVLPVGVKDEVGVDTVKVFCPKCQCVYHPPPIRSRSGSFSVDGASFGTTFAHLFLMTFSNLVPDVLSSDSVYVPRVFGFRVHQSARQRNGTASSTSHLISSTSTKGNSRTATGSLGQNALVKDSTSLKDRQGALGTAQSLPQSSGKTGKEDRPNQNTPEDALKGEKTGSRESNKGDAIGEGITEDQNSKIGNGTISKRKSKTSSASESMDIGNKAKAPGGSGESSLRMKTKRQKKSGSGVT